MGHAYRKSRREWLSIDNVSDVLIPAEKTQKTFVRTRLLYLIFLRFLPLFAAVHSRIHGYLAACAFASACRSNASACG